MSTLRDIFNWNNEDQIILGANQFLYLKIIPYDSQTSNRTKFHSKNSKHSNISKLVLVKQEQKRGRKILMRCFQEKENCSSQINYVFTASDKAGTERVRHPLSNITTEIVSKSISQQKPFAKKGHNSLFAIYSKKIGTDRESLTVKKYRKFATESKNLNQFVESKCSKSVSKNLFPSTDPYSISQELKQSLSSRAQKEELVNQGKDNQLVLKANQVFEKLKIKIIEQFLKSNKGPEFKTQRFYTQITAVVNQVVRKYFSDSEYLVKEQEELLSQHKSKGEIDIKDQKFSFADYTQKHIKKSIRELTSLVQASLKNDRVNQVEKISIKDTFENMPNTTQCTVPNQNKQSEYYCVQPSSENIKQPNNKFHSGSFKPCRKEQVIQQLIECHIVDKQSFSFTNDLCLND